MIADPSCKKCTPAHARSCGGPFHISSIVAVICQPEGSAFFLKDTLLGSLHCPSLAHRHTSSECNLRRPFAAAAPGITTAPQWDESQARATSRQPNARCSQTETSFKSPAHLHYLLKVHIFFLFVFFVLLPCLQAWTPRKSSGGPLEWSRPRETMAGCRQGTVRGRLISCKATKQSTRRHATATPIRKSLADSSAEARLALQSRPAKTHAVANIGIVLPFSIKGAELSATLFPGMTVHGRAETPKPASG